MAIQTLDSQAVPQSAKLSSWAFFDRWIFTFMAGLLLVTVLTGFIPSGQLQLEQIEAGMRGPFLP